MNTACIKNSFAILLALILTTQVTTRPAIGQQEQPSKAALIQTLKSVTALLERQEFAEASKHLVLPPDFKPQMLAGLIENNELSAEGVQLLEEGAVFGKATERFGSERADALAKRAGVPLEDCYGFKHEHASVVAEVLGVWDSGTFKLFRIDDVGKLKAQGAQAQSNQQEAMANPAERLPELEKAVADNPDSADARARYAMALFQVGNLPAAWSQLIKAHALKPDHSGVAQGIGTLVQKFSERDLFTVGIPAESISGVLGEPAKKVELGKQRVRWVYGFIGVELREGRLHEVVDLRGLTEKAFRPAEVVSVDLDQRGWRCGHRRKNRGNVVAFYFLPGESLGNWNEQVVVERILNGARIGDAERLGAAVIKQFQQKHPDLKHKVLSQDDGSVVIAMLIPAQEAADHQNVLVRYMIGAEDVHRLAITIKGDQPSTETQKKWLGILQSATLQKVDLPDSKK